MNITGMGIVSSRGRGLENFRKALSEGWKKPEGDSAAYTVPAEALTDNATLKDLRRADDLCRMACLAATDAFNDSQIGVEDKASLGVILATAFGPHPTTFRFLDEIISYKEPEVSPTAFSHSVHNAALSYVSNLLQSRGPTLTITQFAHSFHQAVSLAQAWLDEGRCQNVLVGTADQYGTVMDYICGQKLNIAPDGVIRPFSFGKDPVAVPGEGSVFFMVSNRAGKKYASLSAVRPGISTGTDLILLDSDGMTGTEEKYIGVKKIASKISGYTPIFGSMLTGCSFSCAAAALMLKEQFLFAAPVLDNPNNLKLVKESGPAALDSVNCLKYGCCGERIEFSLEK